MGFLFVAVIALLSVIVAINGIRFPSNISDNNESSMITQELVDHVNSHTILWRVYLYGEFVEHFYLSRYSDWAIQALVTSIMTDRDQSIAFPALPPPSELYVPTVRSLVFNFPTSINSQTLIIGPPISFDEPLRGVLY
jgi:hypothetical protein